MVVKRDQFLNILKYERLDVVAADVDGEVSVQRIREASLKVFSDLEVVSKVGEVSIFNILRNFVFFQVEVKFERGENRQL